MGPSEEHPAGSSPPLPLRLEELLVLVGQFLPQGAVFSWSCSPGVRTGLQGTQISSVPGHQCG